MLRRIRTILCALSLLPFLAILVLWSLSRTKPIGLYYKHTDDVPIFSGARMNTPHFHFATIEGGKITVGHWRYQTITRILQNARDRREKELAALLEQLEKENQQVFEKIDFCQAPEISDEKLQRLTLGLAEVNGGFFTPEGLHTGPDPLGLWRTDPLLDSSFAGIAYRRLYDTGAALIIHDWHIPIWPLLVLLFIAPLLRGYSLYRKFLRRHLIHCPSCGYDLRATPNLCPECGRSPQSTC